ncbi:hypothetical protein [Hyunsoonleella pacifica]|uniref:Cell wall anchor protein n=1 Tax=Hyunsoonleella pacifica TaxID=1080224 RepID=A0A4Q9FR79_9FLAO|nr:hypothetical protein [Hyunsoonleella pacifica]TBN17874.1 hypothetical protein EYD46_06060 [Hyunsoonleella pacifica]GGD08162.1 hypothetical protein GCM10011368_07680 [Hyunsoonleella pacifica]
MKRSTILLAVFLFLISIKIQSQIGIGNTNPDPTAILDITSTTQGVLTPRMTTTQRNAIASPAEGLLVFDTDDSVFYFYDSTGWLPLESVPVRDNYKLIKSAADLADELTAGGGSTYMLDENTYYEINGTIALAAPIDLNNAYISGLDANEDILVYVGGTIFSGANGGSIRNLTLTAPGGSIFNLTGTLAQTLIFQNSIIANANSVGAINTFGVVFMNIIQLVGNTTGITYTNIGNLLLSNVAWFDSNGGTFETYVGTFSLIEKISGFCNVPAGATGINVSSNPTVTTGVINSTTFAGAGTYVNRYTIGSYPGYNFTNDWNIECPGLPSESDALSIGYYYMTGNTTVTDFVAAGAAGTDVKIAGATTPSANLFRMSSTDNRLTYEGKESREFEIFCTGTVDNDANSPNARIYEFALRKIPNIGAPTILPEISSERRFSNNDIGNFTLIGIVNLEPGDAIEIYASVNNVGGTLNTVVTRLSVVLK